MGINKENLRPTTFLLLVIAALLATNYMGYIPELTWGGNAARMNQTLRKVKLKPSLEKDLHRITVALLYDSLDKKIQRNYHTEIGNLKQEINFRNTWSTPTAHVIALRYCTTLQELNANRLVFLEKFEAAKKAAEEKKPITSQTVNANGSAPASVFKKMIRRPVNTWGNVKATAEQKTKNEFSMLMSSIKGNPYRS